MSYINPIKFLWKRHCIVKARNNIDHYESLKAKLLSYHPDNPIKTIMFTSCTRGNGVSTLAINFANVLASDTPFRVLLIGVNLNHPILQGLLKGDIVGKLSDSNILESNCLSPIKIRENLYLLLSGYQGTEATNILKLYDFIQLLNTMRDRFDYIILDAAPVHDFPESLILSSKVDGIILVIDSGKIRKQVAMEVKKQLEESGGKILGVIINKYKYYIPNCIYRKL